MNTAKAPSIAGWNLKNSYSQLPSELFSRAEPTAVRDPTLVILNAAVAEGLGLNAAGLGERDQVSILAGNALPPGSQPIAQAYAGHQFGHLTMLGDGRAILLGEQETPSGKLLDVQLKGAGQTQYSRRGDGRASLGPMLRELIISHAMQALGIPTTLSLAVVRTGESIRRYEFEPGAVLTRIAASHIRVGTFQYAAALPNPDVLKSLADYAIRRHYPHLLEAENLYLEFLKAVIDRQASLVAQWMHVGFIHGVMNTDNVSISGETIDYGPCAFMNAYSPSTVFSSIDEQGRYSFGNQPGICQWNLARFAETLLPLLADDATHAYELANEAIHAFPHRFLNHWLSGMRKKIGLIDTRDEDQALVESLLTLMDQQQMDYTRTFRDLTTGHVRSSDYETAEFKQWLVMRQERLSTSGFVWGMSQELMRQNNPVVIPRNHRVEEALAAAVQFEDLEPLQELLIVLTKPFDESTSNEAYRSPPPEGDRGYRTFCGT